jgi:GntR family transcriptional regulator
MNTDAVRVPKTHLVRTELDGLLTGSDVGDPVPSERELAVRFGVARETVRQALHELLVEGRVERRGRGTVVSRPKLVQPLSLKSYT